MNLDDGVADLQLVHSRLHESQRPQLGRIADLDHGGEAAPVLARHPEHEPLQARRIHHVDLVDDGQANLKYAKDAAGEADAN